MSYESITVTRDNAVTQITLNRPDKLNALSFGLLGELRQALEQAAGDDECRCVVLTGTGRGFSTGADLSGEDIDLKPGEKIDFGSGLEGNYHPVLRLMRGMDKPVIAAINGIAAGAGCNIGLAADIVVATRSAQFIQAFVRIGLVPDAGGTWSIPRLIGRQRALQWMMSGEAIDAETAERWGMLAAVYDDEQFDAQVSKLAARMASQPTQALAGIKKLVDASLDNDMESQLAAEAQTQTAVGYSSDTLEGIMAFVEKRPANFTGK